MRWLTLTFGVRSWDDNREQQQRDDQHQRFAPYRRDNTITSAAFAADDASRIRAPGIARHVPDKLTRLAARLLRRAGPATHANDITTNDAERPSSRTHARSSHVDWLASVVRARTHRTRRTNHPARLAPNAQTVATPLNSSDHHSSPIYPS